MKRKILSALLATALFVGAAIPAFATVTDPTPIDMADKTNGINAKISKIIGDYYNKWTDGSQAKAEADFYIDAGALTVTAPTAVTLSNADRSPTELYSTDIKISMGNNKFFQGPEYKIGTADAQKNHLLVLVPALYFASADAEDLISLIVSDGSDEQIIPIKMPGKQEFTATPEKTKLLSELNAWGDNWSFSVSNPDSSSYNVKYLYSKGEIGNPAWTSNKTIGIDMKHTASAADLLSRKVFKRNYSDGTSRTTREYGFIQDEKSGTNTAALYLTVYTNQEYTLEYDLAASNYGPAHFTVDVPRYVLPKEVKVQPSTNGEVTFEAESKYTDSGKTKVEVGDTVTVTVSPESGYELDTLTVKDSENQDVAATMGKDKSTYTFTMPESDVTISAAFQKAVVSVALDKTELTLKVGETGELKATVEPEDAADDKIEWDSLDKTVAAVDQNGLVTALKVGTAEITATAGGKTAVCKVTVSENSIAVEAVTVKPETLSLKTGDTATLKAEITPANATNQDIEWTSSAPAVVSVSDGKVTALTAGEALITAKTKDGGKTAVCKVTVSENSIAVEAVTVQPETLSLKTGDTATLKAEITPANATNQDIEWTSSAPSVVSVSDGKVTALTAGEALITAKTKDGGKTAACKVTVLKEDEIELPIGDTQTNISLDELPAEPGKPTDVEITENVKLTIPPEVKFKVSGGSDANLALVYTDLKDTIVGEILSYSVPKGLPANITADPNEKDAPVLAAVFDLSVADMNRLIVIPQRFDGYLTIKTAVPYEAGKSYRILARASDSDPFRADGIRGIANQDGFLVFQSNHLTTFAVIKSNPDIPAPTRPSRSGGGSTGFSAYWITAKAGPNGSISPDGETKVEFGDSLTVTVTPDAGYAVDKVLIDGTKEVTLKNGKYTFENVNEPYTIEATFKKIGTEVPADAAAPAPEAPAAVNPPTGDSWFSHLFNGFFR